MSLRFITDGTAQADAVASAVKDLRDRAQRVGLKGDQCAMEVALAAEDASRRLDCYGTFEQCFEQLNDVLKRIEEGRWRDNAKPREVP
jgi:hypothetical protein